MCNSNGLGVLSRRPEDILADLVQQETGQFISGHKLKGMILRRWRSVTTLAHAIHDSADRETTERGAVSAAISGGADKAVAEFFDATQQIGVSFFKSGRWHAKRFNLSDRDLLVNIISYVREWEPKENAA